MIGETGAIGKEIGAEIGRERVAQEAKTGTESITRKTNIAREAGQEAILKRDKGRKS